MAASHDPVLSAIWENKEVVEFDETYAILDRVANREMVGYILIVSFEISPLYKIPLVP